jgi:tetratricopeptide (TPR) repeat protein
MTAMRGTTDKVLYNQFINATNAFPPTGRDGKTAQQVFQDSYAALDDLATNNPFPQALAWKAYALALSVYECWPLPASATEHGMSEKDRLDKAKTLGEQATSQDDTDYDVHWGLADVYLIRGDFDGAVTEFERALELDRDGRHPSLFAEAASAMMQAGQFDKAEHYFRRARLPDWHHWMHAIFLFLKAGRATGARESFLNAALDDLKSTSTQVGDDFYQGEIQLVLAAVHWRKWELFLARANAENDPDEKARLNHYAGRNLAAATRAIHIFRAAFPYWTVDVALNSLSLKVTADEIWWGDTVKGLWGIP